MARILIVEDERLVAWNIEQALSLVGHTVLARVVSGAAAIQSAADTRPDLVIMDIRLEGSIDGITAAQAIWEQFGIPFVYLTAHTDDITLQRAMTTQPFGYLVKPFQNKELQTTVDIALLRHQLETQLANNQQRLATTLQSMGDGAIVTDLDGVITLMNTSAEELTGWQQQEALGRPAQQVIDLIHAETREVIENPLLRSIQEGIRVRLPGCLLRMKDGRERPVGDSAAPIRDTQGEVTGSVLVFQDISDRLQEYTALRQYVEIFNNIELGLAIHSSNGRSLQLVNRVFAAMHGYTVEELIDKPIIELVPPDYHAQMLSIIQLVDEIGQQTFESQHLRKDGTVFSVLSNITTIKDDTEQIRYRIAILQDLSRLRQLLVLPDDLTDPPFDNQSVLYADVDGERQDNLTSEVSDSVVEERTVELQQALVFEALLKRITDHVRDSLDEDQILQTAVEELANGLGAEWCDAGLYNLENNTITIGYECIRSDIPSAKGAIVLLRHSLDLYRQILHGQYAHFCFLSQSLISPRNIAYRYAILSCPMMDERGVFGDLWLFKPQGSVFNDLEIRLVQQVANQCAIALRQARLYRAAQQQVEELERLNQLKDDFLSTVSHELRTPLSSIRMATQMLEINLRELGVLDDTTNPIAQYFRILKEEGWREINLINDLLDLTRLEAGIEPFMPTSIDLQTLLPRIAEPFIERIRSQNQQLLVDVPTDLPMFVTDVTYLERIVTELLQNAYKFTPSGETIRLSAQAIQDERSPEETAGTVSSSISSAIYLSVTNTGVEIPGQERDRIFEKFYRIPSSDPWQHGGTGLGLTLVRKLVEHLGGSIRLESAFQQTTFILHFSNNP